MISLLTLDSKKNESVEKTQVNIEVYIADLKLKMQEANSVEIAGVNSGFKPKLSKNFVCLRDCLNRGDMLLDVIDQQERAIVSELIQYISGDLIDKKQIKPRHKHLDQFNHISHTSDEGDYHSRLFNQNLIGSKTQAQNDLIIFAQNNDLYFDASNNVLITDQWDISGMNSMNKACEQFLKSHSASQFLKNSVRTTDIERATGDSALNISTNILLDIEDIIQAKFKGQFPSFKNPPQVIKFYNFGGDDIQSHRCGPADFWKSINLQDIVSKLLQGYLWGVSSKKTQIELRLDNQINLLDYPKVEDGKENYSVSGDINNFIKFEEFLPPTDRIKIKYFKSFGVALSDRELINYIVGWSLSKSNSTTNLSKDDQSKLKFYIQINKQFEKREKRYEIIKNIESSQDIQSLKNIVKVSYGSDSIRFRKLNSLFISEVDTQQNFEAKKNIYIDYLKILANKPIDEPTLDFASVENKYIDNKILAIGLSENPIKVPNTIGINQGDQSIDANIDAVINHLIYKLSPTFSFDNFERKNWRTVIKSIMISKLISKNISKDDAVKRVDKFFDKDVRLEIIQNGLDYGFSFIIDNQDYDRTLGRVIEESFENKKAEVHKATLNGVGMYQHFIPITTHSKRSLNPRKVPFRSFIEGMKNTNKSENLARTFMDIISVNDGFDDLIKFINRKISKDEFKQIESFTTDIMFGGGLQFWNNRMFENSMTLIKAINIYILDYLGSSSFVDTSGFLYSNRKKNIRSFLIMLKSLDNKYITDEQKEILMGSVDSALIRLDKINEILGRSSSYRRNRLGERFSYGIKKLKNKFKQ